ncbi:MAG TPA: YqaE/Pmp3 family membrane protein [Syntrophomonadaceae bacterium]|nr:YqaE/Pmp3 family membrane protein [Syntrophomonadaceae bacterium]
MPQPSTAVKEKTSISSIINILLTLFTFIPPLIHCIIISE